nr:MAG: RNA dependent RNA polymerase [Leviviridae sp.]
MTLSLIALYSTLLHDLNPYLPFEYYDNVVLKPGGYPTTDGTLFKAGMDNLTYNEVASVALVDSIFKKYEDTVASDANDQAYYKFVSADVSCTNWRFRPESLQDDHLLGEFRDSLYRFFVPSHRGSILANPTEFFELGGVGPGASVGSRGTDFYTKMFDGPLTCTSEGIHRMYRNYIATSPSLINGELARAERYGDVHIVEGSKLSFVPKNDHISRVICTEPVLNMWAQKGVGELIAMRLKQVYGINLSTQPDINRELARVGSARGHLSTIDLSSASDSISHRMCLHFLPRPVMDVLEALRCRYTKVNPKDFNDPENRKRFEANGDWLELGMLSSMGNGFTFPLETAIFACVVDAAHRVKDIPWRRGNWPNGRLPSFGVFGDDIICKTEVTPQVIRLLELLGFTTNSDKTFVKGPFRESCGGDYFRGRPVRGVYIKHLRTMASRYVAINRLNEWSAVTGIPLPMTVRYIAEECRLLPVPLHENDDAGIKVSKSVLDALISRERGRGSHTSFGEKLLNDGAFNDFGHLSMKSCMALQELARAQGERYKLRWELKHIARDGNGSLMYRRSNAKPYKLRFLEDAIVTPKGAKKRFYNAEGALQAFLHGNIEAGDAFIRHDNVRYLTNRAVTPHWDHLPTAGSKEPVGTERWDTALWLNLMM